MADGAVPPGGGGGVAGIITAVGGLVTAVGVAVAAIMERRARARAAPQPMTAEEVAELARAVVRAEREAETPRRTRRAPAKPAKPAKRTKGRQK